MNDTVRLHYDECPKKEWDRLKEHPFEFLFTTYEMDRFIQAGDSILDIGGGPGRYAIFYAKKNHPVTLVDLSENNVRFARKKAREAKTQITAFASDCLDLDKLPLGEYDHVFLMGPLYHLLSEADQKKAVEVALRHLKKGGHLYVSFIMTFAGVIYDLKNPGCLPLDLDPQSLAGAAFTKAVTREEDFSGHAFTDAYFIEMKNIDPFMKGFPLEKVLLFGQEGILGPNEKDILSRKKKERDLWIDLSKRLLGMDYLLPYSEHAMWIGRKTK